MTTPRTTINLDIPATAEERLRETGKNDPVARWMVAFADMSAARDRLKAKARDLEAALREARQRIYDCKHNAMFSSKETVVKYVAELLPRIDAALSTASGDRAKLKGDPDVDDYIRKEREKQARIVKGLHDYPIEGGLPPASGEASGTKNLCDCERSHNGLGISGRECDCPAAIRPATAKSGDASGDVEAPNVERGQSIGPAKKRRNARERAALEQYQKLRTRIAELEKERDSTRAEGIAAMRECAAKIARNGCLVPPDGGSPTESERLMCEGIAAAIREAKP